MILAAGGGFSAQLLLLLLRSKKEKAVVSLVPDSSWISAQYKGEIFSTGVGLLVESILRADFRASLLSSTSCL